MFTKKITISTVFIAVFAVVALAPVAVSNLSIDTQTVAAWGDGGSDGSGGESGDYGGDGCGGCGSDPTLTPTQTSDLESDSTPAICNYLRADGQAGTVSVPYGTQSVSLTWETSYANNVTLNGSSVAANNTSGLTTSIDGDTTFRIVARNTDGNDSCVVNVQVESLPAASCDLFEATPDAFYNGTGGQVTLTWETTNAQSVSISGVGNFADEDGGTTVNLSAAGESLPFAQVYTLTAIGVEGNDTCTETVTVYPQNNQSLTCQDVSFTASDTTVSAGASVNLSWVFTGNVTSASLSPNVANPLVVNNVDVTVNNTMTYYMEIGNAQNTVACPLTITVTDTPDTITCADNVTFTASNYSLPSSGGDVALTWTTTGVDSINIAGVASNNLNDSEVVNVSSDRTYTLQATADGTTINCPLSIDVATSGGGGGSSSPRCDLDISDDAIKAGQEVTLSWSTSRTEEVRIEDNHGNVLVDTEDDDELDGEITIKPTKDTEFTLYAIRGTRERECEVEVEVENTVTVYESRSQEPRVAGISLTQVPYTGFEAGPALTAIFYTILTIWGLFVAYVVVIRRDRVAGVSFAGAHDHVSFTDQSVEATSTEESSVAEGYVYEATASDIPANLPTAQPLEKVVGYEQYVNNK